LGNQLFQWAALHAAYIEGCRYKYLVNPFTVKGREFALEKLSMTCQHIAPSRKLRRIHRFQVQLGAYFHRVLPKYLASLLSKIILLHYEKRQHHYDPRALPRNGFGTVIGFFEHWKYVEGVWPQLKREILDALDAVSITKFEFKTPYLALHVRRGDNLVPGKPWGNLSSKYYFRTIENLKNEGVSTPRRVVILTDDLDGAVDVTREFPNAEIYGPDSLDAWQTLKVMSRAEVLLAANSTLSWWGGFIGSESGSIVVFPFPYYQFRDSILGKAFLHPNFKISQAEFVESYM
jgi:hypothetical protein